MQLHIARVGKHKNLWGSAVKVLAAFAFVAGLAFSVNTAGASVVTHVVDEDGMATNNNCNSSTPTPYTTVSAAVTAATAGDVVKVCPGVYTEDVVIGKALYLKGAKAGHDVDSRTFAGSNESTITGLVTINAPNVTLDGFSVTNPNQGLGVIVKTAGNEAVIKKNIVDTVGSATFVNPTVGVYLEEGPDNVKIADNKIAHVSSQGGSAQGILVGDSGAANPSVGIRIDDNMISDMMSVTRGAYGVQLNNGASTAALATGYTEAKVRGNTIKNLSGNWAHAIGLEGETPNAVVEYNRISGLSDPTPTPGSVIAVFFEDNQFFFTASVNHNKLDAGATGYGIAVEPTLAARYSSLNVDGECNYWGASNGPGLVAAGSGSLVSTNVDYKPWLKSANLDRDCDEKNHHGHHNNWKDDDDDWHNHD